MVVRTLTTSYSYSDAAVSNPIAAQHRSLTKAKLVDDLNEKILYRPGVIELVEKNIIPSDDVQQALKGAS